jgi:hypothetical protein
VARNPVFLAPHQNRGAIGAIKSGDGHVARFRQKGSAVSSVQSIASGSRRFSGRQEAQAGRQPPRHRDDAIHAQQASERVEGEAVTNLPSIEAGIRAFFSGLHEGDLSRMQAQLARDAVVSCYEEGECVARHAGAWLQELAQAPRQSLDLVIEGIDAVGDTAHACVSVRRGGQRATQFFSLSKRGGAWRIAGLAILPH